MDENNVRPQDLWEPAKPGEKLEDVWVPNRKQRRWMKCKKNQTKAAVNFIQAIQDAQNYSKSDTFKKDVYKDLYNNLKKLREQKEKELKEENDGID